MKNVLHLIETSGPGGAEKMLINLVESLPSANYTSIIGLMKDGWLSSVLSDLGHETLILPHKHSIDLKFSRDLVSVIKGKNIDVMHAHEFAMNVYGSMASAVTGVPIVTTVHGKNYYGERLRRRLAYRLVSRHSKMVAVSNDIADFLTKTIGIQAKNIITIHNGVRIDGFRKDSSARNRIRNMLGLSDGQPLLGTVGNLYPVKGHIYLIQATAIIKKSVPDVKTVIAGRGMLLDRLKGEVTGMGLEKNIEFLGYREDIPQLLQAMDIFILPSLSEGTPLSILEAMASLKPVVATDVGGLSEIIDNGETGLLVPSKDPGSLAAKILLVLENREFAEKMAAAARKKGVCEYDLSIMVRKYIDLYEGTPELQ